MTDLRGINLAMMTPFKVDGAIDFAKFEDLIERYLQTLLFSVLVLTIYF